MSIQLIATIGGLALLDTLSPATIGVTIYLLLSERRQLASRLFVYLAVVAGVYFTLGVCMMLGLDAVAGAAASIFENRVTSWVLFSVGAVLFIASFFVPTKKKRELPQVKARSLGAMAALGLTTSIVEASSAFPYFAAIGLMVSSELNMLQWLPLLLGYNFIMVLPPILLYMLHILFGRSMQQPLNKLREKAASLSGSALSWIMCIVGLLLIFNTLDYL